jgi:sugar lactone lactonase YvrE
MTRKLETLLDGIAFGEGPRWRDGELYFSDMHAHEVVAMKPSGLRRTVASFDGPVSGLGWLPDGRMLVVSMNDKRLLRQEKDGAFVVHGDMSKVAEHWTNDMVVDAAGHAFVGNFGFSLHPPEDPKPATLARVDPDGSVHAAAPGLTFPNGMVITPDGKTLVVAESFGRRLSAFDLARDGTLSNHRVWAELAEGAVPDGICLDADGAIWVASPMTNEVLRVKEGGSVAETIKTEQMAIACMLGGNDRKTLFILTSASTEPEVCAKTRVSRIQATQVEVPGAGLP